MNAYLHVYVMYALLIDLPLSENIPFATLREELLKILTRALAGDSIAAEYLLCSLISSVYG